MKKSKSFSRHQILAAGYALIFFTVVLGGYIPGLTDSNDLLLGLFHIDPIDDVLHTFSGVWASWGAWNSRFQAVRYFRWFGLFYTSDAFIGFFTGYTILDLVMLNWSANTGFVLTDILTNIKVNIPHFFLGPVALYIGYYVYQTQVTTKKNT